MDGHEGEDHLARTARIYDSLPYTSRGVFRTHPARLAGIARLYGLEPAPLANARVLELGCAAGGNLIPLAVRYPEAQFLGIDLGQVMIEDGQARIAAMRLGNIELRTESITDLPEDSGPFDYIICHGVYSWVPAPVRDAILDICGRQLAPQGVAYISYNVLPGWRLFQPIRDAMRIVSDAIPEAARARQGRSLLKFLAETTPHQGVWGELLRRVPGIIGNNEDYLFHEYMEPENAPCMFMDFVGDAGRHGLAYLGESVLATMFVEAHGREFAAKLDAVTGDIVQQQQMLDILVGTPFRTSLLVKQSLAERIDRSSAAANLRSLFIGQAGLYEYERVAEDRAKLSAMGDPDRTIDDPGAIAMLARLFDPIPRTWSLEDLFDGLGMTEEAFFEVLSELIAIGVVAPLAEPLCAAGVSERPLADALVRGDAAQGRSETTNLFHKTIELSEELQLILPHLDGEHSHAQLADLVVAAAMAGKISLPGPDGSPLPQDKLAEASRTAVAVSLDAIARSGLLSA